MAQPNSLNPTFEGEVTAQGFATPGGNTAMTSVVQLNGTTAVNVIDTTNGFYGSVVSMKVITGGQEAAAAVTLKVGTPTASPTGETTVATITSSDVTGSIVGSSFGSVKFYPTGTMTVVSDSATDTSTVEVMFTVIPAHKQNP